jgi:RNA polymerase sigma factor FliA
MDDTEADLERDLWRRYREREDGDARKSLILRYTSLVRRIAASLYARRPDNDIEFEEYAQFGTVGLIESVERYRPGSEASFATYATYRIRGAILSGIEKMTERREQSAYQARIRQERLASIVGAAEQGRSPDLFHQMVDTALGLALGFMLEDTGMMREQNAPIADTGYGAQELHESRALLVQLLEELPERDRSIIRSHYFHHVPFEQIARDLEITKGRVSQLHKRALDRLRQELKERRNLDSYL